MPKYHWQVSYTPQGAQGLKKDGGTARRAAVQKLLEQSGGKLESFYFALGDADAFIVADLPDAAAVMAISLVVSASGAARVRTSLLMTPEEMDAAAKKTVDYRPPGAGGK
jgi:uncharacterized protein with GYD domain